MILNGHLKSTQTDGKCPATPVGFTSSTTQLRYFDLSAEILRASLTNMAPLKER